MWTVIVFNVIFTLYSIIVCTPRANVSDPSMTTGHCFDSDGFWRSSGIFNVLSDFAILVLPMPTLWNLQSSLKKRLLTMSIFATGSM